MLAMGDLCEKSQQVFHVTSEVIMKTPEAIWVPVEVKGYGKISMPFMLLTGWTTEQRNRLANLLKVVWEYRAESRNSNNMYLCWDVSAVVSKYDYAHYEEEGSVVERFMHVAAGDNLPSAVKERQREALPCLTVRLKADIREAWLLAQIGMAEVRTDFYFGGHHA